MKFVSGISKLVSIIVRRGLKFIEKLKGAHPQSTNIVVPPKYSPFIHVHDLTHSRDQRKVSFNARAFGEEGTLIGVGGDGIEIGDIVLLRQSLSNTPLVYEVMSINCERDNHNTFWSAELRHVKIKTCPVCAEKNRQIAESCTCCGFQLAE